MASATACLLRRIHAPLAPPAPIDASPGRRRRLTPTLTPTHRTLKRNGAASLVCASGSTHPPTPGPSPGGAGRRRGRHRDGAAHRSHRSGEDASSRDPDLDSNVRGRGRDRGASSSSSSSSFSPSSSSRVGSSRSSGHDAGGERTAVDGMDAFFSGADFGAPGRHRTRPRGASSVPSPSRSPRRSREEGTRRVTGRGTPPPPPPPVRTRRGRTASRHPVPTSHPGGSGTRPTRRPPGTGRQPRGGGAVVVVEGLNDARAVQAAGLTCDTVILKGSYDSKAGHYNVPADVIRKLAATAEDGGRVVVLTDSDTAGRQLRSRIVLEVPRALHAFIGVHESSASVDTEHHRAGNVGVEHAAPGTIRRALRLARRAASAGGSTGVSRAEFARSDLEAWGLCGPLGESAPDERWRAFGGVAARRRLVGEYLGVGDCDAKQLLRQMNLFFAREEVDAAIAALPREGEKVPAKMTDGGSDRGKREEDEEPEFDIYAYVAPGEAPPGFR